MSRSAARRHAPSHEPARFRHPSAGGAKRSSRWIYSTRILQELVAKGKSQGYLTYDEVNDYLPDEAVNPDKLDNLLIALEEAGDRAGQRAPGREFFDVAEQADRELPAASIATSPNERRRRPTSALRPPARWPSGAATRSACTSRRWPRFRCLTREEEISLAKKIEVTRKRFRRTVIGCNLAMQATRWPRSTRCTAACCPSTARSRSR